MKRIIAYFLVLGLAAKLTCAADWNPEDDTFDPSIHSVVVGDRSWLGDPSPFVHVETPRTGYTHVNTTRWEGFPPSVQISLMVPLHTGEEKAPGGGMLLLDEAQTVSFIAEFEAAIKADPKKTRKRYQIPTAFKGADWALTSSTKDEKRTLQLENKNKEKTDTYRFSINASKKLLGAIRHSLEKLKSETAK